MLYLLASGGLILFVIFRLFRKKKEEAIKEPTMGYRPTPLLPSKSTLSFDEIFQWIRKEEGQPSFKAVKDGKTKGGMQLYSIGLGHQIQPNESNLLTATLTENEVLELFKKDIDSIIKSMNKVIKVPVTKNQQLALLSLRYNIGVDAFNQSTLLRKLNAGDYTGASTHFAEWRLSEGKVLQGLVNRRERERVLFLTEVSDLGTYVPPVIPPLGTGNFPKF